MNQVKVRKHGNSLSVLINRKVRDHLNVKDGDMLDIVMDEKGELKLINRKANLPEFV